MNEPNPGHPDIDARSRLAAIVESSDDAIVSKTLEGIVTSWNKGAERIFGYTAEEMIGRPISVLFPEDRLNEEPLILARLARGERVDHFQTIRRAKDGRLLEVSVTISPVRDSTGRIAGASKIARDITAEKNTERALRAARDEAEKALRDAQEAREQAETANRAKDQFLSILSHELRTPLTPVLAAVSMLEATPVLSTEEIRRHVGMIRRNVETEARIVDDLLDVTRISRGKVELHLELADAHAAVRNVTAMLQAEIDAKGHALTVALRARDHFIMADPGRFQQVLLNLLSNAIKFTPHHGSITLQTSNAADQSLLVEVIDSGTGIDADTLPRLFHAFEQGEKTNSRKFGGLGLGLSIVRALMQLHGGSATAASAGAGKGATFAIQLPTVPAAKLDSASKSTQPPVATPSASEPCRVLLVEDHDDTRHLLQLLLGSFGCSVMTASSVREARELADQHRFDLLLSDIGLPDGTGLEVMRHIRQRQAIRGIALSGFGQDADLQRSREAGFQDHLIKPINLQTLREVVQGVTG